MTSDSVIRIRGLTKDYKVGSEFVHALRGVDLDIRRNEFVAIMGASGSGKSTLMNILGCLDRPSAGAYELNSRPTHKMGVNALSRVRNEEIGFVFQSFELLNRATALKNVMLPLIYSRRHWFGARKRAKRALERVGLGDRMTHRPNQLSGGQRQRVAIARALVNEPSLLLADEPTGNLDTKTSVEIIALFKELHAQGQTIVIVTHEEDIAGHAQRIVRLRDGKVMSDHATDQDPIHREYLRVMMAQAIRAAEADNAKAGAGRMNFLRLMVQTFALALEQLWANRFRAVLTTLGIVIGVASVIAIVGATDGLRKTVLKTFEQVGASRFVVFPRFPREAPGRFSRQQIVLKKHEAFGLMNYTPSVARLTPVKSFGAQVQYTDRVEQNVQVQGVLPHWNVIEGRTIQSGRPFMSIDEDERRSVCLINDRGIQELNLPADPSGESILIAGRRFLIVGVVETKTLPAMFGGGEPLTEVFIPFATADAWKPEPVFSIFIQGQTKSPELYPEAKAEIRAYLRKSRGLGPGDPDTFQVQAVEQFIEQIEKVAFTLTLAAVGIVAISLIVGGVGIMNIMLASVSERTREIGLRKAVGAQPAVILMQFLVEAVVLCLVGAGLGLAIGFGIAYGAAAIPNSPLADLTVPTWAVILAVGFSAATGVIFGMFPAIKAARLDPIEALRHE